MNKKPLIVCILAAGKGARMESEIPKVLHKINGTPMIIQVINTAKKLNPNKIISIVGYKKELVQETVRDYNVECIVQNEQKGTAHAVLQCEQILKKIDGNLLVLSGDVPLITEKTLRNLIEAHFKNDSMGSLISTIIDEPHGYGRIIRDRNQNFTNIVEQKDTNEFENKICEINSGIYIFNIAELFKKIHLINNKNNQNEYYLTDVFNFMKNNISVILTDDVNEISGINTVQQLEKINED